MDMLLGRGLKPRLSSMSFQCHLDVFQREMDDFERRVLAEIDRLEGPEFPAGRRARRQRVETIRALAEAAVAGEPWTGEQGVLGPRRPAMVVSETNFYSKKHWYQHALTREVIENVIRLYMERDAAERERARLAKRVWLENKELEAAQQQFDKAGELLKLPHIVKKMKKPGANGEEVTILDPANAAVFNAAAKLNVTASDLARRSLGLPTDVSKSEVALSMSPAELKKLSDEELERIVNGR